MKREMLHKELTLSLLLLMTFPFLMGCVGNELIYSAFVLLLSPFALGILFRSLRVFFITLLASVCVVVFIVTTGDFLSMVMFYGLITLVPLVGIGVGIKGEFDKGS